MIRKIIYISIFTLLLQGNIVFAGSTGSEELKGSTLKDDYNVWKITRDVQRDHGFDNFCIPTKQKLIPKSRIFRQYPRKLRFHFKKKKYLGVCIPGLSIHLEKPYIKTNDFVRFSIPD